MSQYPARLDGLAKTLTLVVLVVIIIPFITVGEMYAKTHTATLLIAPVLVLIGLALTYMFHPTGYDIGADAVLVHRPAGNKKIPLSFIVSCEPVSIVDLGFGVRTFASGGFLGYFGKFWYRKIGHVNFYATDRSKLILMRTQKDKKYLISPENGEAFIRDLRGRLNAR